MKPLQKASDRYPAPAIRHASQGRPYAAKDYVKMLRDRGTQTSMAARGKPNDYRYAKRLVRTIKQEEVYRSEYQQIDAARQQLGYLIDVDYYQTWSRRALDY